MNLVNTFDPTVHPGVYQIRNRVTGDRYIGSTTRNFRIRWAQHRSDLARNKGSRHLNGAWLKYGPENFEFTVILVCDSKDVLLYEQRAIDVLRPEYNLALQAGNTKGVVLTPERRAKIAAALRGRDSARARRAVVDGVDASYVQHATRIGVVTPAQARARLSQGWSIEAAVTVPLVPAGHGLKSPEARAHQSALRIGKKANISPENLAARNAKIAEANRKRVLSDESRQRMSDAHRARGVGARYTINGKEMTAMEVAAEYDVSRDTFHKRVKAGWDPERAATTPTGAYRV